LPAYQVLHVLDVRRQFMVQACVVKRNFSLSVAARYRGTDAYLAGIDSFVRGQSTHAGTLNRLLNAGALRPRLAQLCWTQGVAIDHGTSRYANREGCLSTMIDFANLRLLCRTYAARLFYGCYSCRSV
jgi:hypothetical protein